MRSSISIRVEGIARVNGEPVQDEIVQDVDVGSVIASDGPVAIEIAALGVSEPHDPGPWYVFDHETDSRAAEGFETREEAQAWLDEWLAHHPGDRRVGALDPDDATGRYEIVDARPL